ncbi:hypothetical protein [Borrelia puertoricensis]|uniref:hypothetical protein n=1 Tax=Borrelia puertoricensis TaxID=2756107 RepID=UPI001FF6A377|nr:hypothetical protein [Borrelia puertoricensis]UPA18998.1 hypothetical protein bpuSUM_001539 [Borrelia puertoricensis]
MKKIHIIVLFLAMLIFGCNLAEGLLSGALVNPEESQQDGMSMLKEVGKSFVGTLADTLAVLNEKQISGVRVSGGKVIGEDALEDEEDSEEDDSEEGEQGQKDSNEEKVLGDSQGSDGVNSVDAKATETAEVKTEKAKTETETETVASSQVVLETPVVAQVPQEVAPQVAPKTVSVAVAKEEVKTPSKPAVGASNNATNSSKKVVTPKAPAPKNKNTQQQPSKSWWSFLCVRWDYGW